MFYRLEKEINDLFVDLSRLFVSVCMMILTSIILPQIRGN